MKRMLFALAVITVGIQGAVAQSVDTLGRIKAAHAVNVAYSPDSLPFSLAGTNGEPAGYTIDLCKRVIAQIGRAVGDPALKVNWIAGSVGERLDMIASGRAQLECANTTPTQSRLTKVDFSNLIFVDAGGLLVKAGSPIRSTSDLSGKRIAVLKGTTSETRLGSSLRRRLIDAKLVPIDNAADGIAMLESGTADAYAGDKVKLVGLMATAKDPTAFALLAEDVSFEPYALALPRGDKDFTLSVNRVLARLYRDGDIVRIYNRWLGSLGPPSVLLSATYYIQGLSE